MSTVQEGGVSRYRFYVGDAEIPVEAAEINMTSSIPAYGDLEWKPMREATATFALNDPNDEWVRDLKVGDRRTLELTSDEEFHWSRWRRWLNAVLRFAWWPLGPEPLPKSYGVTLVVNDMRIERVTWGEGMAPTIEMSNRLDTLPLGHIESDER
jgi:hypothetical protein